MRTNRTRTHRPFAAAAVAFALFLTAACGSDASDGSPPQTTATTDAASPPTSAAPNGYCEASLAIESSPGPEIDFATATEDEMATAAKAYAAGPLRDLFDAVAEVAPPELEEAIAAYDEGIRQMAKTGDFSVFDEPDLVDAESTVHAYDLDNCGWEAIDVVTTDYAFGGIDDEYPAGPVSFELTNEGDELHELVVLRIDDEVDLSAEELLALPEDEAQASVQPVGGTEPIMQGARDYLVVDLQPGRYLVSCFLPKGAASFEALGALGEDAEPHAAHGMVQEITVG